MKESSKIFIKNHESAILSILGLFSFCFAVLFLEQTVIAGICSVLGLVFLLSGGRRAKNTREIVQNGIVLWLAHCIRFSTLFGTKILYIIFTDLAFIPYCLVLCALLFLDRWLYKKGHHFLALLVMPIAYGLLTWILALLNLGFILNFTSYIMYIPLMGVTLSVFGEYFLSAILLFILLGLISVFGEPQKTTKILFYVIPRILIVVLFTLGAILSTQWKTPDYTIEIALATGQELDFDEVNNVYTKEEQLDLFKRQIQEASNTGADLLVFNEEYFMLKEENVEIILEEVSKSVKEYQLPTLITIEVVRENDLSINEALYFDKDGQVLYTYVKNNLVPFMEAGYYVDGEETPACLTVDIGGHTIDLAFVICYDVNDEAYLQKIPSTTELLLVPSWDWDTGNIEQKRTVVRSATLGLTMVKHSYEGFSTVSCPNGTCETELDFRGQYETVQTISVPIWEKD